MTTEPKIRHKTLEPIPSGYRRIPQQHWTERRPKPRIFHDATLEIKLAAFADVTASSLYPVAQGARVNLTAICTLKRKHHP